MLYKTIQVVLVLCLLLTACSERPSKLEQIRERGELVVATHNGPATYFVDKDGETGLEYELAMRFALELDVSLSLIVAKNEAEVIELIKNGQADIAAGGINNGSDNNSGLLYGPDYQWVTRQIVYRTSHWRPTSPDDIYPEALHIADGTIPVSVLQKLREQYPTFSWVIHKNTEPLELLQQVENGEILYALAKSNDVLLARASFPEVRPAFNLSGPDPLAWAVRNLEDKSLLQAIEDYHQHITEEGKLADLIERFYGPSGFFDYVDSRKFIDKYRKVMPSLRHYFKRSAEEHEIDWRLLAALSYQESHWNKNARSRTGVRGLMMLTQPTARQVGVDNRLDPEQSIEGGALYLKSLLSRIPERISEPDRTWFALAAYNVGLGHLEDARVLTERDGGDADLWQEVKLRLPLLSKKKWYKDTRYGYARGYEPVKFVGKIRKYYSVLVQLTQEDREPAPQLAEVIVIDSPVL